MSSAGGDAGGKGERAAVRGTRRGWPRRCQGRGTGRSEPTPLPRGGHGTVQYSNLFLPDGHSVHLGVFGPEDPQVAEGVRVEVQVADCGPLLPAFLPLAVAADHAVRDACQAPAVPVPPTPSPHPRTDPAHHRQAKPQTGPGFCLPPGRGPLAPRKDRPCAPLAKGRVEAVAVPPWAIGHVARAVWAPPSGHLPSPGLNGSTGPGCKTLRGSARGPAPPVWPPHLAPPRRPHPLPVNLCIRPPPHFPRPPLPHHHPPAPGSGNGYG